MAAKQLPATIRKLVANRMSQKFRDVVSIAEVPTPQPGDGQVLVKNRFVGINASDINFTAGRYDPSAKFPLDVGFEAVGEVVATGQKSRVPLGTPVAYLQYGAFADYKGIGEIVAAGPNCGTLKEGQNVMYMAMGAFSDYKVIDSKVAVPLPSMNPEFLPFILSGNTAALALDKVGDIKPGETVLVTAAAGGTGQFAVQWAKNMGCHVIGTCSSDEKVTFLKEIGCDRPVNYKTENLRQVLKKEYPKGVDVVYESIGGEIFDICVDSLAIRGRLIIIGYITSYENDRGFIPSKVSATLPARLLPKSASIRGFFLNHFVHDLAHYIMKQVRLYGEGKLKSFTDKENKFSKGPFVGLEKIVDAVEYLYSQKSIGKIVVEACEALAHYLYSQKSIGKIVVELNPNSKL